MPEWSMIGKIISILDLIFSFIMFIFSILCVMYLNGEISLESQSKHKYFWGKIANHATIPEKEGCVIELVLWLFMIGLVVALILVAFEKIIGVWGFIVALLWLMLSVALLLESAYVYFKGEHEDGYTDALTIWPMFIRIVFTVLLTPYVFSLKSSS